MISCQRPATAISVNPVLPHQIVVGCSDSTVRTYDRRMLGTPATGKSFTIIDVMHGLFFSTERVDSFLKLSLNSKK